MSMADKKSPLRALFVSLRKPKNGHNEPKRIENSIQYLFEKGFHFYLPPQQCLCFRPEPQRQS